MSSVGNWTKKTENNLTVLANDRSTPAIVHLVNVRQAGERALGERSPRPTNMRTRASPNPAGALDNLKCDSKSPS
jgi:hypothetical protein